MAVGEGVWCIMRLRVVGGSVADCGVRSHKAAAGKGEHCLALGALL